MTTLAQTKIDASKAFDKIGKSVAKANHSSDNRATIAHEFFIAKHLESIAKKRAEAAKKEAQEAGLLRDDYDPDTTVEVYRNETLAISAKTANAAQRLDPILLKNELMKKLGAAEAVKLISQCTVENKPATSYIFSEV